MSINEVVGERKKKSKRYRLKCDISIDASSIERKKGVHGFFSILMASLCCHSSTTKTVVSVRVHVCVCRCLCTKVNSININPIIIWPYYIAVDEMDWLACLSHSMLSIISDIAHHSIIIDIQSVLSRFASIIRPMPYTNAIQVHNLTAADVVVIRKIFWHTTFSI